MKNSIKLGILVLMTATLFSACNKKKNAPESRDLVFHSAHSNFLGDPNRMNVDFYDLYLYDSKLTNNPDGDGTYVYLQLNTETTTENVLIPGRYTVNTSSQPVQRTYEKGAWQSDSQGRYVTGSYIGTYIGSETKTSLITNGEITISRNGNSYHVSGIVTADGNQYKLSYRGQVEFVDMVVPLPNTLTHGEIWYHGDPYGNGLKIYSIRLGADDVKISNFSGSGDAMQIEIYTPLSATTIIPDATYPVKIDQVKVYTAIDGYYDANDEADYGTWYYTSDALSINSGSVKVQYMTGSTYRLDFNLKDDYYGYEFAGTYEGELAFVNKTTSPIAVRSEVRGISSKNSESSVMSNFRGRNDRNVGGRYSRSIERKTQSSKPAVRINRK